MSANGEPANKKKKVPHYAVINLTDSDDIGDLFQVLQGKGFGNVTFLNHLTEHPDVREVLKQLNGKLNGNSTARPATTEPDCVITSHLRSGQPAKPAATGQKSTMAGGSSPALVGIASMASRPPALTNKPGPKEVFVSTQLAVKRSANYILPTISNRREIPILPRPSNHTFQGTSSNGSRVFSSDDLSRVSRGGRPPVLHQGPLDGKQVSVGDYVESAVEDPYTVICQMCNNKIMCTRLSNLTNHVKRHAATKQYQCVFCTYQHNEQAKVRAHMLSSHKDGVTPPMDALSAELQKTWSELMDHCFPGYLEQMKAAEQGAQKDQIQAMANMLDVQQHKRETIHNCIECGDAVAVPDYDQMPTGNVYAEHIIEKHLDEEDAYECAECHYTNVCEWKLRSHISARHPEKAHQLEPVATPMRNHIQLFIRKYFPEATGLPKDPEDERLEAERRRQEDAIEALNGGSEVKEEQPESDAVPVSSESNSYVEENEMVLGSKGRTTRLTTGFIR